MAVPTHFRFTFRGVFLNTPESWSFGLHFSRDVSGGTDAGVGDIDQDAVTDTLAGWFNDPDMQIPSNAMMTDWRAYEIGTDNRMENNPLVHLLANNAVVGGKGFLYPPQIAMCITTVGANRGPARFGRFYLPTAATLGTDRRVSVNDVTTIADRCTTALKDISDHIDLGGVTASSAGLNISQKGSAGARQDIDHLEVGRVLDTLRNRRKSMVEDRFVQAGSIDW